MDDKWLWEDGDLNCYTVRSGYNSLRSHDHSLGRPWFKQIWNTKAVGPAQVCAWRVLLGKLPTRVNLVRRQVMMLSTVCPLCNNKDETVQHVFFECIVAQKVWDNCDRWIGIHSVRHNKAGSHLMNFYLIWFNKKVNTVWKGMWLAIVWEIWRHRNNVVFNAGGC